MRVFVVVLALSVMLSAAPMSAQAPAPALPPAAGQTQKPPVAAPAPQTQKPAAPAQPAGPPPPTFQAGMKYAYVNYQQAFLDSAEGRRVQTLFQNKQNEIAEKSKALEAARDKAVKQASVLSDEVKVTIQNDLDRQQRELERLVTDAEEELQRIQQQEEQNFARRLGPVIQQVAKEKQIHFVFREAALFWADPGVDLTPEVIALLSSGAAQKPAAPAAAAPGIQKPAAPATAKP
jgi:Skp family chaperone for outer membrane proteins